MAQTAKTRAEHPQFIQAIHGIRYQVKDVARSVAFYTQQLGFKLEHQQLPAFASVSLGHDADPAQRTRSFWIQAAARWATAGTWGMESRGAESGRSGQLHR